MANEALGVSFLTSLFVSVIVTLLTGFFCLKRAQRNYLNEYYRLVLKKRIVAYEHLEKLIKWLRISVIDSDLKPYRIMFSSDKDWENAFKIVAEVAFQSYG